jgi:hypothetical protein
MTTSAVAVLGIVLQAGPILTGALEVFLYALLNAYYCYEYKTAALELEWAVGIQWFEAQWAYYCGFGFLFTLLMYMCKGVGSSLFILFFHVMVMGSLDEGGQGLLAYS